MGQTHYNEVSHDRRTLYTATRSIGQIEEGLVGLSVTDIDKDVVSWRFLKPGELPAVAITSPGDERLMPHDAEPEHGLLDTQLGPNKNGRKCWQ